MQLTADRSVTTQDFVSNFTMLIKLGPISDS